MTDTRTELDERLLKEARSREQGLNFRRVLGLIAGAVLIAVIGIGQQRDQAIAFAVAGLLLVAAVVIALRGDRLRR
jgi:hypothetical protein